MINKLYKYLSDRIDFNNYYTIKKSMAFLESEYNSAVKSNNPAHATQVLEATNMLYNDFSDLYRNAEDKSNEMSYTQKVWFKKLNTFIDYLQYRLAKDFNKKYNISKIEDLINLS